MFLAWIAGRTESLEQKCEKFHSNPWPNNTYDGPDKSYYICRIKGQLKNEVEVTTDTTRNTKSNREVTMVAYYPSHTVKFIPNSLFDTFLNLEYLLIYSNNKFETMRREYLRNANKLKNLWIYKNSVRKIDGNVFLEAKKLEHVNFESNKIESVHKEAFKGILNLKGVYLQGNKIKNLHPSTFSATANLNILQLGGRENCVNEKITSANEKFPEIEAKILDRCTYQPFPDEVQQL